MLDWVQKSVNIYKTYHGVDNLTREETPVQSVSASQPSQEQPEEVKSSPVKKQKPVDEDKAA